MSCSEGVRKMLTPGFGCIIGDPMRYSRMGGFVLSGTEVNSMIGYLNIFMLMVGARKRDESCDC